jgi:putative hemolysin
MIQANKFGKLCMLLITFIILFCTAFAMRNPSAVYCGELGYDFYVVDTPLGQIGKCQFPDGTAVSGWDFLRGTAGEDYNYCAINNYDSKPGTGYDCGNIISDECLLCIVDGKEVEVTVLMELDFTTDMFPISNDSNNATDNGISKDKPVYQDVFKIRKTNDEPSNPFQKIIGNDYDNSNKNEEYNNEDNNALSDEDSGFESKTNMAYPYESKFAMNNLLIMVLVVSLLLLIAIIIILKHLFK